MMFRVVGLVLLIAVSTGCSGCGSSGGTGSGGTGTPKVKPPVDLKAWEADAASMSNNDSAIEYTKIAWEYYNRKSLTMAGKKLEIAKKKLEELEYEDRDAATMVTVLSTMAPAVFEIESKRGGREMLEKAVKAAASMKDAKPEARAKALMTLAVAQHKVGQADESTKSTTQAEELASGVENKLEKTLALASLAAGYQQMEKSDETSRVLSTSKETADGIEEPGDKVTALCSVAAVEAKLKLKDEANATYKQAQDAAGAIEKPEKQAYAYISIGESMVNVGMKGKAYGMAQLAVKASDGVTDPSLRKPLTLRIDRLSSQCR